MPKNEKRHTVRLRYYGYCHIDGAKLSYLDNRLFDSIANGHAPFIPSKSTSTAAAFSSRYQLLDLLRNAEYHWAMIKHFKCRDTESLFHDQTVRKFKAFEAQARRRLKILHATTSIESLGLPLGNRLHKLSKDRTSQYSISINMQWRICFVWNDGNACEVEIVDYH